MFRALLVQPRCMHLQAAAAKRILVCFCAISLENGSMQDFANGILAAENATVTCTANSAVPSPPDSLHYRSQHTIMPDVAWHACADLVAIQEMCMLWLRTTIMGPSSNTCQLVFPYTLGATDCITCCATAAVVPITSAFQPATVCKCHGLPVATMSGALQTDGAKLIPTSSGLPVIGRRQLTHRPYRAGSLTVSTCPITNAAVRIADCNTSTQFVQLNGDNALRLMQHSPVNFAPPAASDQLLRVFRRAKVRPAGVC